METNESIDVQQNCEVKPSMTAVGSEKNEINVEIKNEIKVEAKEEETTDAFQYTRRGVFTSENYKIEVKNLPKFIGYDALKKLLKKLELNPLKTKLIGKPGGRFSHGFVTFRSDEERDKAIDKLDNYLWKNKELIVRKANPIPDPLVEKRKESQESDDKCDSKRNKSDENDLTEDQLSEKLNDKIANFWRIPYSQQIVQKYDYIKTFLDKLHKQVLENAGEDCSRYKPCLLDEMKVSPVVDGYRNKCEFTVGIDKTVGFRLGLYKEGTVRVISPGLSCPIIGDKMRKAMNAFQTYLTNESQLEGYNPEIHSGHWIQCTVRTTVSDSMVIMALHPQQLTQQQLMEEKQKIIKFFETHSEFEVNSVYIHISKNRHNFSNECLEHLFGEKHVFETINMDTSLKFRISPLAFFQINTIGAQICFKSIMDLIKPTPELTLLDICCGTGTIGQCLASKVKKVIGIELNAEAISDANVNSQLNGISNVEYIEGKAEDVMAKVLDRCPDSEIVAVIDPPRAGLNNSIIRVLRSNSLLNRLVYVSCDPNIAIKNMIDLCRPTSKSYKGKPFAAIRAIPVDLFPHTNRCELVLLFERIID